MRHTFKGLFATLAIIGCLISSANAGPILIRKPPNIEKFEVVNIKNGTRVGLITISGKIDETTTTNVHNAFLYYKANHISNVLIHLNSQGGMVTSGSQIGIEMIDAQEAGINVGTMVGHQELCASMCTGIYAMGEQRVAATDSIFIFHSPYVQLTFLEHFIPFLNTEEAVKESRETLMAMYKVADPIWTEKELKAYVYSDDGRELVITGRGITQHSRSYVTILY